MEIMHEQAKVLKKKKFRSLPAAKKRKLMRASRLEILHGRQKSKAWLETHIWHAKRMKMIETWGYRLAYTPTEKAFRPSYRATVHGVIVSDVSYYQTIELKGQYEALKELLSTICDAAAVPASSKRFSGGIRECQTDMYYYNAYPTGLIGPVSIIWDTPSSTEENDNEPALRQLFIRIHPSILKGITSAVEQALQAFQRKAQRSTTALGMARETAFRNVGMYFRNFCAFEVTGPMATDTVKACLRPVNSTSDEKKKAWSNSPPPSAVPAGTILALDVYDPRLTFPPKLTKPEQSHGKPSGVVPLPDLARNERFWDATVRKKLIAPRYKKIELDERRSKLLIPGTPLSAEAKDDRIPILLIQRTLLYDSPSSTTTPNPIISGWTLLIPSGWGQAFWHSLVYSDTRIGGLRERAQQNFEAGIGNFPDDFPTTSAFRKDNDLKVKELREEWERKPPAKRMNFEKLGTKNPWKPNFGNVVEEMKERYSTQKPNEETAAEGMDVDRPEAVLKKIPARKEAIWLLQGTLLSKLLEKYQAASSSDINLEKINALLVDLIRLERIKRQLGDLPDSSLSDIASRAIVKVSLAPLGRGAPCYNAMIYGVEKEQAEEVRKSLEKKPAWMLDVKGIVERSQKGQDGLARADDLEGDEDTQHDDDESAEGEEEEDDNAESVDKAFRQPDSSKVIGYLTTGNMSLARGRGFGIGSISLLALLALITQDKQAGLGKQDPKLLVLFRNPSSRVCRAASLQVVP